MTKLVKLPVWHGQKWVVNYLTIEAVVVPGKGKTSRTGQLEDVMQESIQVAHTVVRSRAASAWYRDRISMKKRIFIFTCQKVQ